MDSSTVKKTAANLLELLRENGPTPIDSILNSYQTRFRENLNLQGVGLHGFMAAGLLPGIRYRKHDKVLCLEAKKKGRAKAAGEGLAKLAQTVAPASTTKGLHVQDSKQQAVATAPALSAPDPPIATSRARDHAVPGLLMVTDVTSYAEAVEMFVPRAGSITVKTLEQACAGCTVGLRVLEDFDHKTTGALTHIQASINIVGT